MTHKLVLDVPNEVYNPLADAAKRAGATPEQLAIIRLATTNQTQQSTIEQRFRDLVDQWKEATEFTSSTTEMVLHPAYQQIIGMGPVAIPFLIAELRRDPDHWFAALKSIA